MGMALTTITTPYLLLSMALLVFAIPRDMINLSLQGCDEADICYHYDTDIILSKQNISTDKIPISTTRFYKICSAYQSCRNLSGAADDYNSTAESLKDIQDICQAFGHCRDSLDIPDKLAWNEHAHWLCPTIHFCRNVSELEPDVGTRSCCSSCSCAPDCGRHHECCYASDDRSNVVETENLTCLPVQTTLQELSFYMVYTCLDGKRCIGSNEDISPVSSFSRRRIYASKSCALCNGVLDFKVWHMLVMANAQAIKLLDIVDLVVEEEPSITRFYSAIVPSSSKDKVWIKNFLCSESEVSDESFSNQGMLEACRAIRAPFISNGILNDSVSVYQNVHCAIGNSPQYSIIKYEQFQCDLSQFSFQQYFWKHELLLDLDIVKERRRQAVTSETLNSECKECDGIDHKESKPVLCPYGMTLDSDGQCRYAILVMRDASYTVHLQVMPLQPLDTATLGYVKSMHEFRMQFEASCPFAEGRSVVIHNSVAESNSEIPEPVDGIVLSIFEKDVDVSLEDIVREISECFHRNITINVAFKKHYFQIMLASNKVLQMATEVASGTPTVEIFENIEPDLPRPAGRFVELTKGYFCKQVELSLDEFKMEGLQIRILHNNKILGNNQYDFLESSSSNSFSQVRVCLGDFLEGSGNHVLDASGYTESNVHESIATSTTSSDIGLPSPGNDTPSSGCHVSPDVMLCIVVYSISLLT